MKRRMLFIIVTMLVACMALAACGGQEVGSEGGQGTDDFFEIDAADALAAAKDSLNDDGSYTVQKGNLYIGIRYDFEDGTYWELMTICQGDTVIDCARNCPLERFMYKEEYVGKTYEQAFRDFYEINHPAEDHGLPTKITLLIMENDREKKYEKMLAGIKEDISPAAKTGFQEDDKNHFDEAIVEFTEDLVFRLEEEERRRREEAEEASREEERIRLEEEARASEEEERRREEERLHAPVSTASEIKERKGLGVNDFTLAADLVINMEEGFPTDVRIDCEGHSVIIKGIFRENMKGTWRGIELWNASSVDLSGLTIDRAAFRDEDFLPEQEGMENHQQFAEIVSIIGTNYKNVTFPVDVPNRDTFDDRDKSVFEGYFVCEVNDEGDQEKIVYVGPQTTYEARLALDTAVATAILTNGDADDLLGDNYHGEYAIWTDVEIDMGNVTLPNQDYRGIELKPGASLKISGTIAITGGKLDFTVCEADQLDITGLTLVKKHPSPDMVKIRYDSSAGLNTSLLQAKAGSGTIKFALGDQSYDITIW